MFEQVVMNLAVNARDAMPKGGKLVIATSTLDVDAGYVRQHPAARAGHAVRLSVTDTGCGMDRKTLDRIFEPFFSTKEVGKGTGPGPGHGVWHREPAQGLDRSEERAGPGLHV